VLRQLSVMKSRPTVLASAVLALALLGDSLLYAALPLHAKTFGISVAWIGVLLSANRITRLFAYPLLPRVTEIAGLRDFTIGAAALGAISTLWFAVASGPWPLLAARVVWGTVFGALSLATLAYATDAADGAGVRVGISLSLRELGPIASLTAGMLLVTTTGIRPTLITLGVISLFAIPIAFMLPRPVQAKRAAAIPERRAPANVNRHDVLSATMGFVSDGLFPATIAVLLLESEGASTAAMAAGTILALKRAVVVVLGPIGGRVADRFGALRTSIAGFVITATGTILIAWGNVLAGAIVLVSGAAVSSTAIPLLANTDNERARLSSLARLGLARDVGAAAGPLIALPLFAAIGGALLYAVAAASLLAAAFIARPGRSSRPTSSTSSLAWRPSSTPERPRSTP
jgi:MFS family permease